MKNEDCLNPFGLLIKEEPLSLIDENLCYKHYTVLESDTPFFGYYNENPGDQFPQYLYFMIENNISFEDVFIAGIKIRETEGIEFDDAYCELNIHGNICKSIRIRHLKEYSLISFLQQLYLKYDIVLKNKQIKLYKQNTVIKIYKPFNFVEIEDGLYYDSIEAHHAYFKIDKYIKWEEFKELIREVKYEPTLLIFDAALVSIFFQNKVVNMVRVYKEYFKAEDIVAIRNRLNIILNKQQVI